jgi:hypothetical protein
VNNLVLSESIEFIKPPENMEPNTNTGITSTATLKQKMTSVLAQNAISFANDSMYTTLCLQYPSKIIASAAIYMSAQANKMRPTKQRTWLEILNDKDDGGGSKGISSKDGGSYDSYLDVESLALIVKQIMELIADRKGVDKRVFADIDADLNSMRLKEGGGGGRGGGGGGADRDPKRQRTSK